VTLHGAYPLGGYGFNIPISGESGAPSREPNRGFYTHMFVRVPNREIATHRAICVGLSTVARRGNNGTRAALLPPRCRVHIFHRRDRRMTIRSSVACTKFFRGARLRVVEKRRGPCSTGSTLGSSSLRATGNRRGERRARGCRAVSRLRGTGVSRRLPAQAARRRAGWGGSGFRAPLHSFLQRGGLLGAARSWQLRLLRRQTDNTRSDPPALTYSPRRG
jgi:hypothetical protein